MSRGTKGAMIACLIAAALLCAVLGSDLIRDRRRIREMETELAESRARWEETAARKEEKQAELKRVKEELREAQLTIEESAARAEKLEAEIARLKTDIEGLR